MAGVISNPPSQEYCHSGTNEGFQEYYEISVRFLTIAYFRPKTCLFRLTTPHVSDETRRSKSRF